MRKKVKKLLSVIIVFMLFFGIFGCSSNIVDKSQEISVEDIIKKSNEAQKNIKSLSYYMDILFSMKSEDTSVIMDIYANADCILNPFVQKFDMTYDLGDYGSMNLLMYQKQEGEKFYTYSGTAIGDLMYWMKEQSDPNEIEYDFSSTMKNYLNFDYANYSLVGKENINNKNTYHICEKISGDNLKELLKSTNIYEQFGIDEDTFNSMLLSLEIINIDIWINEDDYQFVKYVIDLSDFVKEIEISEYDNTSSYMDQFVITLVVNDYNNIYNIDIPQAALEAEEFTEY